MIKPTHRIIFFDGVCNLCNTFVRFIIKRDPEARFTFASLQSEEAAAILNEYASKIEGRDTVIYLANGKISTRSTAGLRILKDLGGIWSVFSVFLIIPPFLRDPVYSILAKYRYRFFGKRESCIVPTEDLKSRFL